MHTRKHIYACTHVHMYMYVSAHVHVYVCISVCACMSTGLLVWACTHTCICVHVRVHTCVYMHMCICLFACMCMLNQSGGEWSWLGFCSHGCRQPCTGFSLLWHNLVLGVGLVQQREFLTVPAPLSVPGLSPQPEQLPMLLPLLF